MCILWGACDGVSVLQRQKKKRSFLFVLHAYCVSVYSYVSAFICICFVFHARNWPLVSTYTWLRTYFKFISTMSTSFKWFMLQEACTPLPGSARLEPTISLADRCSSAWIPVLLPKLFPVFWVLLDSPASHTQERDEHTDSARSAAHNSWIKYTFQ